MPTPAERLNRIVDEGMCIGCGICEPIAGPGVVRVGVDDDGAERPYVVGELSEAAIDAIEAACPGLRVEGLPLDLVAPGTSVDPVWGPYLSISLAWAADPEVRFRAATGGVLTAMAQYLLDSGRVALVWQVGVGANPFGGEAVLSSTAADVAAATGSRYGPAAPLRPLDAVLDRGEPFAFVGKPCDVTALRNRAGADPRIDNLCRYRLTFVCGGYRAPEANRRFFASYGITVEDVTRVRYRGYGCPGPTVVETVDGAIQEWDYLDLWGEDESTWSLPFRCKICPDGIGESADLAAADTWPGGSPTRDRQGDDPGTNAIVVRTPAGQELLDAAVRDGYVVAGDRLGPRDLDRFQPHQVAKKQAGWARLTGLARAGALAPRTARLRLAELAREQPVGFLLDQARGTRRRASRREP